MINISVVLVSLDVRPSNNYETEVYFFFLMKTFQTHFLLGHGKIAQQLAARM